MEYEYRLNTKLTKVKFPKAFDSYKKPEHIETKPRTQSMSTNTPRGQIFGAILRSKTNKFLLVKGKESGKYSFPKGHIEPNETPLNCIMRELYEETGLVFDETTIQMKTILKPKIGTYIYCEATEELRVSPKDTKEIEEAGWYTDEEIQTLRLNADAHILLRGGGNAVGCAPHNAVELRSTIMQLRCRLK
jgi:8-oxo-dGTP pyrophosphatase MutT (NUDIX family)